MKEELLNSLRLHLETLHALVADIPPAEMTRQPPGVPNHPAWTLGHLAYAFANIVQTLADKDGLPPWFPAGWPELFATGTTPTATQSGYPSKAELCATLDDAAERLRQQLTDLPEANLSGPLPEVQRRAQFPTLGHAIMHVLVGHTAAHLGQLAVWRRARGLPARTIII